MNALSNIDITRILGESDITINGVLSKDLLPHEIQSGWYIINLENHNDGGGTHWTCFYKSPDNGTDSIYFDSFGFDAPEHLHKSLGVYEYNNQEIQDIESSCCGYFCIGLIKFAKDINVRPQIAMHRFKAHFSRHTVLNDFRLRILFLYPNCT